MEMLWMDSTGWKCIMCTEHDWSFLTSVWCQNHRANVAPQTPDSMLGENPTLAYLVFKIPTGASSETGTLDCIISNLTTALQGWPKTSQGSKSNDNGCGHLLLSSFAPLNGTKHGASLCLSFVSTHCASLFVSRGVFFMPCTAPS